MSVGGYKIYIFLDKKPRYLPRFFGDLLLFFKCYPNGSETQLFYKMVALQNKGNDVQ